MNAPGTVILILWVGVGAQELDVARFYRAPSSDLTDDAWNGAGLSRAVKACAWIFNVDAFERRRKTVGIALPAHFAVGQDIDARNFLVSDSEERRVVLRLLQPLVANPPEFPRADARDISTEFCHGRSANQVVR